MYCLDTYALVEIGEGNPRFSFLLNEDYVIADIALAEFYGVLLRGKGLAVADAWKQRYEPYCVALSFSSLIEAVKFRFANKHLGLSFFDAVGYAFSQENGYTFVTGDQAFKGMKGVKFVK